MKWKLNLKRTLAALLAATFVLSSPQMPVLIDAMAAAYGIRFYDPATGAEEQNTQIVEGSSINIRATLPSNYDFSATPFSMRETGGADASNNFTITPNVQKNYYTLIAKAGSSGGSTPTSSKEYTMDAIYTAILDGATGSASKTGGDDMAFALDVVADPGVSITTDSKLSFTTTAEEGEISPDGTSQISFGTITATGTFLNSFNGVGIVATSIQRDTRGRFFNFMAYSKDPLNPTPLNLKVYLLGIPAGRVIPAGTRFEINFIRQTLNSMILTVVSPQKLVEDAASSIRQNPTDPLATGTGKAYIQLASGETLQSVISNFNMYSQLHRLNVDVNIKWKWEPALLAHKNNVEIKQKSGSPTTMVFDIINRPQEDMRGDLVAEVTYNNVTSTMAKIPIIIYGTGLPPTIIPMYKWTGDPSMDSGTNQKQQAITELPKILDVYRGDANPAVYPDEPTGPFKFTFSVNFGSGRGAASSMKIKNVGGGGEVEVRVDGSPVPHKWDAELPNTGANRGFEVTATKMGQVQLQFQFFDSNGDAMNATWKTWSAYVNDTSPLTDGRLDELNLRGFNSDSAIDKLLKEQFPDHVIPYEYNRDTNDYSAITVPNKVEYISLQPRVPGSTGAKREVKVEVVGGDSEEVTSDRETQKKIELTVQIPKVIKVTVTAQDGSLNTYTLRVTRQRPDGDSTLKDLQVSRLAPETVLPLTPGFSSTVRSYSLNVPYSVDKLKVTAEQNSPWSTVDILPKPKATGILFWKSEEYVDVKGTYDPVTNTMKDNVTTITATVTSEEGTTTTYTVLVTRLAPDDERKLTNLAVLDTEGNPIAFLKNGKETTFSPEVRSYTVEIPYSTKQVSIQALPMSENAKNAMLKYPAVYNGGKTDTQNYVTIGTPLEWYNVAIPPKDKPDERFNVFTFEASVTAESQRVTDPPYTIEFSRVPPETDNTLASLALEDQDAKPITESFSFNPEVLEYDISVSYLTKQVKVTPVAVSKVATITVNGSKMTENKNYFTTQLDTGKVMVVTIAVTAEDGSVRTYTLRITRQKPGTEARLSSLTVGALTLSPKFVPSKTAYSVTIPVDTRGYAVTATTVDQYATLTIDGKAATSGVASETITPVEEVTKLEIVVTAQDGKTKKTYIVTVTDDNLVVKSSNADLRSLKISPSDLNPRFKPGNLEYEAYVKDNTFSVDIVPEAADRHAKVEVFMGSKKIGNHNGDYSSSLIDDENEFRVEVTSPDKSLTNTYYISVFRNNEEKQGNLKPVTAEMVDFAAESPIVVDISKYSIVAADVFNTLKTSYPDKSIIFEGNDYSLEVKGSDLKRLVPNTEQFDFSVSFTSPAEDEIWDVLNERSRNDDLEPVFVYFEHHGELPAPMKFTLSLGREYRNEKMYWNYYNQERERIDYYGSVNTNSRGTFAVTLTHMSTFLPTRERIAGAEDRTSSLRLGETTHVGNYAITLTNGKDNPNTGEDGA